MKEKVLLIVSRIMNVPIENINEESSPESTEAWDSLAHMNLVMALEEEFGVQFGDEDILNMKNVGIILETVKTMIKND